MPKRLTSEEFFSRMKEINKNIEFIEDYSGTSNRIKCRCTIDGHEWNPLAGSLLQGNGCKECSYRNQKMPSDEFIKMVKSINPNIEFLEDFTGVKNRIKCRCMIDGHEWNPIAYGLLSGKGCKKCSDRMRSLTQEEFVNRVLISNPNVEIYGNYINNRTKIHSKCKICGNEWYPEAQSLMDGKGCPKCFGNLPLSNDEFVQKLSAVNFDIEPIDEYIRSSKKIRFHCKICNFVWSATPNSVLRGVGCPVCKESKGEREIRKYLKNNNIAFDSQVKYDGLLGVGHGYLSYDFYLNDYNLLIEFQGNYHDGTVSDSAQTEEEFLVQQEHDRRKREYAKSHNIDLLEIWYYDFDRISEILDEYLGNKAAA